jgi:ligand-binding sensor domain-containing protein/signal transduction histidine kinase
MDTAGEGQYRNCGTSSLAATGYNPPALPRIWRPLTALVAIIWGLSTPVAADTVRVLSGFTVSGWSATDDGTLGPVRILAQDRNGYLWLGTDKGLLRFDGFHFTTADAVSAPGLPKAPVRALLVARNGDLWIGLGNGAGAFILRNGHFVAAGHPALSGTVNTIAEDDAGDVWIGHDGGLLRRHAAAWTPVAGDIGTARVYHVRPHEGMLEIGTAEGLYRRRPDGSIVRIANGGDGIIRTTAEDAHGRTWVSDPRRGLRDLDARNAGPAPIAGRGFQLLNDAHGDLWLTTVGQGLWRVRAGDLTNGIERLTLQNGLLSDGVWALLEDREGNLWVGTHEGLNRLTRHTVTPLVELGITSSIVRVGDAMWVASSEGVYRFSPGRPGQAPARELFPMSGVRTLHADQAGRIWVAAVTGLYQLSNGTFSKLPAPPGRPFNRVTTLSSDVTGSLWFADAAQGLWQFASDRVSPYVLPPEFRATGITAMHGDVSGTIWIAFANGMLGSVDPDGAFRTFGEADGLPHDTIFGFYEDGRSGLWLAGSRGISHMVGGRFVTIGADNGLPGRRIIGITGDNDSLWLAISDVGIGRLRIDEFERAVSTRGYHVRVKTLDTSDGMAGVPTTLDTRTAQRASDGRLWFVTGRGLTIVDPGAVNEEPRISGPVRVEAALADDVRFTTAGAELPAGTRRLRLDYTALNLSSADRLRFRYRLEGFDDDWREAGTRRQAFYTNLPPRAYRFRVQVADPEGAWSTATAEWPLTIAPMFYQRPAFYAACGLTLLLLIGVAWQVRLRQVRREFGLVLAERARLSRDMHDTLLQNMAGVALQIDDVSRTPHMSPWGRQQLLSIRRELEDCIVDARLTIQNMRGLTQGHGDLIAALEHAGARATAATAVRFRLGVTGTPRRCDERMEAELLRIAQEALANAVRHAQASTIHVDLTYTDSSVTLRVADDGTGFEQQASRSATHFGLDTMRERAEQMGGRFRLTTTTGLGTEVETTIPVSTHA